MLEVAMTDWEKPVEVRTVIELCGAVKAEIPFTARPDRMKCIRRLFMEDLADEVKSYEVLKRHITAVAKDLDVDRCLVARMDLLHYAPVEQKECKHQT